MEPKKKKDCLYSCSMENVHVFEVRWHCANPYIVLLGYSLRLLFRTVFKVLCWLHFARWCLVHFIMLENHKIFSQVKCFFTCPLKSFASYQDIFSIKCSVNLHISKFTCMQLYNIYPTSLLFIWTWKCMTLIKFKYDTCPKRNHLSSTIWNYHHYNVSALLRNSFQSAFVSPKRSIRGIDSIFFFSFCFS